MFKSWESDTSQTRLLVKIYTAMINMDRLHIIAFSETTDQVLHRDHLSFPGCVQSRDNSYSHGIIALTAVSCSWGVLISVGHPEGNNRAHLAPDAVQKFCGMQSIPISSKPASLLSLQEATFPFPLNSRSKVILLHGEGKKYLKYNPTR